MAIEKINIEQFLELAKKFPVMDVRSPGEYKHAHIPGAISLPLFSDEERKVVGTAYKQESREQAIKIGLDYFGPKMRRVVEEVESLAIRQQSGAHSPLPTKDAKTILIHCWRGGMRSAAIAWLLDLYGFKVYTLNGGYKKYRNFVLNTFSKPFKLNILGGYTGSSKTGLLGTLKERGEKIIDLEALANHKGSAFGNIGLPPQPGQEMFENLMAKELNNLIETGPCSTIWVEDESQRIGLVNIPAAFWAAMRKSPVYFLDIPFEERLKQIELEYGSLDHEQVTDAIARISQKLGNLNAKMAISLLKEGKINESFAILLRYYDKHYFKSLHNREGINSLLNKIECKSVTPENANLLVRQSDNQ